MQLVHASIGMEFVNAILEPVCSAMRRKLKPLPREEKRKRPTIQQNIDYLQDDDVLSESEAERQQQLVQLEKERLQPDPVPSPSPSPQPLHVSTKEQSAEIDESTPLTSTAEPRSNESPFPDISLFSPHGINNHDDPDDEKEIKDDDEKRDIEPVNLMDPDPSSTVLTPPHHDHESFGGSSSLNKLNPRNDAKNQKSNVQNPVMAPFVFLATKSNPTLTEQWNDVLKHTALNLDRLESQSTTSKPNGSGSGNVERSETKLRVSKSSQVSYRNLVENLSDPLLAAIEDLKSAANVEVEDIESSAKCLKYLREAHKTILIVFRQSKDPLLTMWSAALLIVTSFVLFCFILFLLVQIQIHRVTDLAK